MTKILVLEGGSSNEREVSLRSAASVKQALKNSGFEIVAYDTQNGLEKIADYKGQVDVVFPILHGAEGEDGKVQAELEKNGFKYLGSDSVVSDICFDKVKFRAAAQNIGVLIPKGEVVDIQTFIKSGLSKRPFVLKPICGGSSIDTFIFRDPSVIPSEIEKAFAKYQKMLLEELIEGVEITVAVLGDKALPVIEIVPPMGEEFDFENKYNGKTSELCPPKNISFQQQRIVQDLALKLHKRLGLRHLSRIDFIVNSNGEFYFLEANTMPGMTDQSLFPRAALAAGINMQDLMKQLLKITVG